MAVSHRNLRQIKAPFRNQCNPSNAQLARIIRREFSMRINMGTVDQYVRVVLGLALVAFAFQDGTVIRGWHWVGLTGLVLLVTAFFRSCPLYAMLGISSCPARQ
jgi:hypothetical protein